MSPSGNAHQIQRLGTFSEKKAPPSLLSKHNGGQSANNWMKTNQSFLSDVAGPKQESSIKQKLAYEWKNIYRGLNLQSSSGVISKKAFEKTVHQNGVYLTKEELGLLYQRFTHPSSQDMIDFQQLSQSLGMQSNSLNLVQQTHKYLSEIHKYGQAQVGNALQTSGQLKS